MCYCNRVISDIARKAAIMRTESPRAKVWSIHLALVLLVGMWLTITEYVVDVPFIVTLGVLILIIVAAAAAVHIQVDKIAQHYRRAVRAAVNRANVAEEKTEQIVTMHSTIRTIFVQLYPNRAAKTYECHNMGDYEYGRWLWWALHNSNLMEWLSAYRNVSGVQTLQLQGVLDHIPEARRDKAAEQLFARVRHTRGLEGFLRATEAEGNPAGGTPDAPPEPLIADRISR